ncbi:hypothetical protein AZH53_05825 [Methanomicrobiaceae archaeon CYW5]|uniref:V-type ATP synthase subunit F n=1 Tax=Methanovulcanius yangii TaxID=1789227 RepID=UPI0029C9B40D|nr:V-type ATP synthase subunit F [Methanovulcanius yangii]MBT8507929.1 hypothetical protein [Methanovulcanius yangii]
MKIIAIGDRMTTSACLAGGIAHTITCTDITDAEHALEEVLADEETAIVLVLDRYLTEISLPPLRGAYPVIIGIPGPSGPVHGEDAVTRAVRKVAGRHMPGVRR